VEGDQYASTVVNTEGARNVEGHQYASTVDAISAKIVEGHQYASTVVDAITARILVGVKYASTAVNAVNTKNAKEGVTNEANGTEAQKHAIASSLLPNRQL